VLTCHVSQLSHYPRRGISALAHRRHAPMGKRKAVACPRPRRFHASAENTWSSHRSPPLARPWFDRREKTPFAPDARRVEIRELGKRVTGYWFGTPRRASCERIGRVRCKEKRASEPTAPDSAAAPSTTVSRAAVACSVRVHQEARPASSRQREVHEHRDLCHRSAARFRQLTAMDWA